MEYVRVPFTSVAVNLVNFIGFRITRDTSLRLSREVLPTWGLGGGKQPGVGGVIP